MSPWLLTWLFRKFFKKCCVLCRNFISIYIINITFHSRLGIQILSSRAESISHSFASLTCERYFQYSKIKFVSPRGHEISSIYNSVTDNKIKSWCNLVSRSSHVSGKWENITRDLKSGFIHYTISFLSSHQLWLNRFNPSVNLWRHFCRRNPMMWWLCSMTMLYHRRSYIFRSNSRGLAPEARQIY